MATGKTIALTRWTFVSKENGAVLKRAGPPDAKSWLIRKDPDAGKD